MGRRGKIMVGARWVWGLFDLTMDALFVGALSRGCIPPPFDDERVYVSDLLAPGIPLLVVAGAVFLLHTVAMYRAIRDDEVYDYRRRDRFWALLLTFGLEDVPMLWFQSLFIMRVGWYGTIGYLNLFTSLTAFIFGGWSLIKLALERADKDCGKLREHPHRVMCWVIILLGILPFFVSVFTVPFYPAGFTITHVYARVRKVPLGCTSTAPLEQEYVLYSPGTSPSYELGNAWADSGGGEPSDGAASKPVFAISSFGARTVAGLPFSYTFGWQMQFGRIWTTRGDAFTNVDFWTSAAWDMGNATHGRGWERYTDTSTVVTLKRGITAESNTDPIDFVGYLDNCFDTNAYAWRPCGQAACNVSAPWLQVGYRMQGRLLQCDVRL